MPSLKTTDVLGIALIFWLLFLGGCEKMTKLVTTSSPQLIQSINPTANVVRITATPLSIDQDNIPRLPLNTARIEPLPVINPQMMPDLPTATQQPISIPTRTPVIPLETENDPRYPNNTTHDVISDVTWAMHQIPLEDGRWQDVLYVYDKMRKVKFHPGMHPTQQAIDEALRGIMDGTIEGEPIESYG